MLYFKIINIKLIKLTRKIIFKNNTIEFMLKNVIHLKCYYVNAKKYRYLNVL